MAYEKLNLNDGDVLKAEHLAHMESGIETANVRPDWNQTDSTAADFIKNKPFGEALGDTLTWAIDTGSLDFDSLPGGMFVKVSDAIVTMTDLANGCTVDVGAGAFDMTAEAFVQVADGVIMLEQMIYFVDESAVGVDLEGLVFPESGVYVVIELPGGRMTIPGYTSFVGTKQMDVAYLPSSTVRTVVLHVGLDDEGVNRIYKDSNRSERLTRLEMYNLLEQKNCFFTVASSDGDTDLRYVVHAHNGYIVYATYTGSDGVASFNVANTFDA